MAFKAVVKKAVREKIFAKIALMAPSGGGKTYSALRLATGMAREIERTTGKEARILMLNTEAKRGYYYANEFNYDIVDLEPPHEPEMYVEAIEFAVREGYDIVIIDSSSHEWEGKGGCLEIHNRIKGNSYTAWAQVTPRHQRFIEAIADSPIHVIATMRGKDQYEMIDDGGKKEVKKLGVGAKQRDGFEYEFTCTFLIDQKTSCAEVQKDNTHIFEHDGATLLTENHGRKIIEWANSGEAEYTPVKRPEPVKAEVPTESNSDPLKAVQDAIIEKCVELGGQKNTAMMELLKSYVANGNPRAIKSYDKAVELLNRLDEFKEK